MGPLSIDLGQSGTESQFQPLVTPEDEKIREIFNEFDDWKSGTNLDRLTATEYPNPPYVPFIPYIPEMPDMMDLDDKESSIDIKHLTPVSTVHSLNTNTSWAPIVVAPTYEVVEETTPLSSAMSIFSPSTTAAIPTTNVSMFSQSPFPEFPNFPQFPNVSLFNNSL